MTTDGGGWQLILAYAHAGGENNALVYGTIPTDPVGGYSHQYLTDMAGFTSDDIAEVRFYCRTSGHNRVIHFKTSNSFVKGAAFTGSAAGNSPSHWKTGFTALDGHTANLPAATNGGDSDASVSSHIPNPHGLTETAFSASGLGSWLMRPKDGPGFGSHFRCDDGAGLEPTTLHQIWVRAAATS